MFESLLLRVCEITGDAWAPIFRELQGIALVRQEGAIQIGDRPFLRFHPTLTSAVADGTLARRPEIRLRFIHVYLDLMQALDNAMMGSQSSDAMEILEREETNYRTALQWAIHDGLIREAAQLGSTFSRYLRRSGRLHELIAWVAMLKDITKEESLTEAAAIYEREDAYNRLQKGDTQGAVEQLRALIERLRSTTDFDPAFQLAISVGILGRVFLNSGASNDAIPILEEAVSRCEALVEESGGQPWELLLATGDHTKATSDLGNLSAAMGDLANALRETGQYDKALKAADNATRIHKATSNMRNLAVTYAVSASILMVAGRYEEADARYDLALNAIRQVGDKESEALALDQRGCLAHRRNQSARADTFFKQALSLFQAAGNRIGMMRTYNHLGNVELKADRLAEARAWYVKSRQLAMNLNNQSGLGDAAQNIGTVCRLEGEAARKQGDEPAARLKLQAALDSIGESLRIERALDHKPGEAGALIELALIYLAMSDLDTAEHHALNAHSIHESLGLKGVWKDCHILSQIAKVRGDTAAAADWAHRRDAKRAEMERLAGGGDGLSSQTL